MVWRHRRTTSKLASLVHSSRSTTVSSHSSTGKSSRLVLPVMSFSHRVCLHFSIIMFRMYYSKLHECVGLSLALNYAREVKEHINFHLNVSAGGDGRPRHPSRVVPDRWARAPPRHQRRTDILCEPAHARPEWQASPRDTKPSALPPVPAPVRIPHAGAAGV